MDLTKTLLLVLAWISTGAQAATLQDAPWPAPTSCDSCITLQVRHLEMKLPPALVGRILSTGANGLALDLVPPSGDFRQGTSIFDYTDDRWRNLLKKGRIVKTHGIDSAKAYWTAIGQAPKSTDPAMALVRKVEGITDALSYTRYSKGPLTAFVVDATDPIFSRMVVTVDGDARHYLFAGPLSTALREAILAHAAVAEFP